INGTRFTARTPACLGWAAGERIRLIAGDWNGRCVAAVFYNFYRRSTCEMWCGGGGWGWGGKVSGREREVRLTRVTRIFQLSVFTKIALAVVGAAPRRFLALERQ